MVPRRRPPLPPPPPMACPPPPSQASRPSKQSGVGGISHHRRGWGRITHNAGNHSAPSPSPPLRHTDENDGDDVVHNDVDVLFPVWLLVVRLLLCCSGLRHRMFTALFS